MTSQPMSEGVAAFHRKIAVEQFNRTWDFIENGDRTADDDTEMLLAAMASRWHWAKVGDAGNIATGDWQVAHVLSLLDEGTLSLRFALRSLAVAEADDWRGWRLASAHEGAARAYASLNDADKQIEHSAAALEALQSEEDAENAQLIREQLLSIPAIPPG